MQFIYGVKTNQSLLRYQFPKEFSLNVNKKHYSNEVILPYVNKERQKMNRPNQVALVIFDVFRGQITDDVLKLFKQNHTDVFVPANMTGILQPLNLTVNGFAKKFYKKKFNHWYMEHIMKQLDDRKSIEKIDAKLQLTTEDTYPRMTIETSFTYL